MARAEFWRRWLLVAGAGLVAFGVLMVLTAGTPAFGPLNGLIDPAFWGSDPVPPAAVEFQSWIYGAWGATIAGWGVTVVFLAAIPLRRHEAWARRAIAAGTLLWFAMDTGVSAIHGVAANVVLNLGVLAIVGVPLLFLRADGAAADATARP